MVERKKVIKKDAKQQLFSTAVPGRIEDIVGRTGMKGEVTQVRCKVMDWRDTGKILRRNAKGPVRIGDILMEEVFISIRASSKVIEKT